MKKSSLLAKKIIISLLSIILLFYLILFLIPVVPKKDMPFFQDDEALVIAHRGGAKLFPENTVFAFEQALALGVDILELDIHMTKDGHLVVIHDATVDRTTDGTGRVDAYTLADLKRLDAAYHVQDALGQFPYRGQGITIPTLEEVFIAFPQTRMIVEIKDAYPLQGTPEIEAKLWELITKFHLHDFVLVGSFHDDILQRFNQLSNHTIVTTVPEKEAKLFLLSHYLFFGKLFQPSNDVFFLPPNYGSLDLTSTRLIEHIQRMNMHIYYWTIDDEEMMTTLLNNGANGIVTDRPDILLEVIQ